MKKFRKIMAVLVAAIMVVAMTVPAWAADIQGKDTLTLTVNHAKKGETYTAFKIFDETQANPLDNPASYRPVTKAEATREENRFVTYYTKSGSTYTAITDNSTITADPVYELCETPVAYTIKTNSPWYTRVSAYANSSAATDADGMTLTPMASDSTTMVVTFTDDFSAADFAADLKTFYDGLDNSSTTPTKDDMDATLAAQVTEPNGPGLGTTDDETTIVLQVGELAPGSSDGDHQRGNGYYFVNTNVGVFCALDTTTAANVDVNEKNTVPSVTKQVYNTSANDGSPIGWDDEDDAQIGDKVYFKIELKDGRGTDKAITVYDIMDDGLSLDSANVWTGCVYVPAKTVTPGSGMTSKYYELTGKEPKLTEDTTDKTSEGKVYYEKITAGTGTYAVTLGTAGAPIEITDSDGMDQEAAFKVVFDPAFVKNTLKSEDVAYICYTAVLNDGAELAANQNGVFLTYSEQLTKTDYVDVYTHSFDLVKDRVDNNVLLADATFNLYAENPWDADAGELDSTKKPLRVLPTSNGYRIIDKLDATDGEDEGDIAITTSSTKATKIEGLDVGTYYLVETVAPNGFIPLTAPIKVTVARVTAAEATASSGALIENQTEVKQWAGERNDDDIAYTEGSFVSNVATINNGTGTTAGKKVYGSNGIEVPNTAGTELPSTGGMGTTVLYIVGGMLVILAGAYLFFSRKRTA